MIGQARSKKRPIIFDEWLNVRIFVEWAIANGFTEERTFNRIDKSKGFVPDNCQWISDVEREQAFWRCVDKTHACWQWNGHRLKKGYGQFYYKKESLAHRISWILTNGSIPDGLYVLHKCDNPPCVNPDHLFLGTQSQNLADMVAKGRDDPSYGENHFRCKLSLKQVKQIRQLRELGTLQSVLAESFGVTAAHISRIAGGTRRQVER